MVGLSVMKTLLLAISLCLKLTVPWRSCCGTVGLARARVLSLASHSGLKDLGGNSSLGLILAQKRKKKKRITTQNLEVNLVSPRINPTRGVPQAPTCPARLRPPLAFSPAPRLQLQRPPNSSTQYPQAHSLFPALVPFMGRKTLCPWLLLG